MWQPIDLNAAYAASLNDVLEAIHAGQHTTDRDGNVWLDDDNITEHVADLIQSGRLNRAEVTV